MSRCQTCWYEEELCVCNHTNADATLARDYLVVHASAGTIPVHPHQAENAKRWVRLVALRQTGDPAAWLNQPWRDEIFRAAWDATGEDAE